MMMNWHHELSSILSETDGSVAKIRERLTARARSPRGTTEDASADLNDWKRSSSVSPAVHWSDDTTWFQTQLQQQRQAIETLTQSVRLLERERNAQQRLIQTLQEELRRLQVRLEERESERRPVNPEPDRRLEQWKREIDGELSSLRGHIHRTAVTGTQKESFSSKLCREELEHLRREIDIVKNKLMRLEEDVFQLRSEARETRRQNEHSSKTLERLTDSQRTQSFEVAQTASQYKRTQQEVCELRVGVSELKDEVTGLILRDIHYSTPAQLTHKPDSAVTVKPRLTGRVSSESEDDFSPTVSLAEISSDESWLEETELQTKSRRCRAHLNSHLSENDICDAGRKIDSDPDSRAEGLDEGSNSLSLSDL